MSKRLDAWANLQLALETSEPACADNDLFILDDVDAEVLKPVCKKCPVYKPCKTYALIERPSGGIWAGMKFDLTGKKQQ